MEEQRVNLRLSFSLVPIPQWIIIVLIWSQVKEAMTMAESRLEELQFFSILYFIEIYTEITG